jgi:hypothetical protein
MTLQNQGTCALQKNVFGQKAKNMQTSNQGGDASDLLNAQQEPDKGASDLKGARANGILEALTLDSILTWLSRTTLAVVLYVAASEIISLSAFFIRLKSNSGTSPPWPIFFWEQCIFLGVALVFLLASLLWNKLLTTSGIVAGVAILIYDLYHYQQISTVHWEHIVGSI